jgi:hypothetical protein
MKWQSSMSMCSLFGNDWVSYLHPLKEITVTDLMIEDKKTTEPTIFIDVNSEHLREVLKVVLKDVKGINLREDKLSVRYTLRHNL